MQNHTMKLTFVIFISLLLGHHCRIVQAEPDKSCQFEQVLTEALLENSAYKQAMADVKFNEKRTQLVSAVALEELAKSGHILALGTLGCLYTTSASSAIPHAKELGVKYLISSAEQCNYIAYYHLAGVYLRGPNTSKEDFDLGISYLSKAVDLGFYKAAYELSYLSGPDGSSEYGSLIQSNPSLKQNWIGIARNLEQRFREQFPGFYNEVERW